MTSASSTLDYSVRDWRKIILETFYGFFWLINLLDQKMQFAFLAFYNKPLAFNLLPHAEHK